MTSVYEQRRLLERTLRRELPGNFLVVSGPDHPFLLRGPDLLVAGEGTLTAIFIPTGHERIDADALKGRLVLSRLALPRDTRPVLVIEAEAGDLGGMMAIHFDEMVDLQHSGSLPKLILSGTHSQRVLPKEVHVTAARRFGEALRASRVMGLLDVRATRKAPATRAHLMTFEKTAEREPSRLRVRRVYAGDFEGRAGVPVAAFSSGRVDSGPFVELVHEQSRSLYSVDRGIPYPIPGPVGLVLVDAWPLMGRDPYKIIRAAAFGGWSMMLTRQVAPGTDRLQRIGARMRAAGEMQLAGEKES